MSFSTSSRRLPPGSGGVVYGPGTVLTSASAGAAPGAQALPNPPLPRHHAQQDQPVQRSGLGSGVRRDRGPRGDQPTPLAAKPGTSACCSPPPTAFISYSEGCNDDVNKAIWSALNWDPDSDIVEVLCQIQPLLYRFRSRGRLCPRAVGPGAKLGRAGVEQPGHRRHPAAVPGNGTGCQSAGSFELAIPAGALPGLLRRLRPQPTVERNPA